MRHYFISYEGIQNIWLEDLQAVNFQEVNICHQAK